MYRYKWLTKPITIVVISSILTLLMSIRMYSALNTITSNKGPLIWAQFTLPGYHPVITSYDLKEAAKPKSSGIFNPLSWVQYTIPYTQKVQIGAYENELEGYFKIQEDHDEMISLEPDNSYEPITPIPLKKSIDKEKLSSMDYLLSNIYMGGDDTMGQVDKTVLGQWDFKTLASKDFVLDESKKGPKVLIFHTHVKEYYADEKKGDPGVAKVGEEMASILENQYGIETLHLTDDFYASSDSYDVTGNYERVSAAIEGVLRKYPSIQVCIDIHRDAGKQKTVQMINGKPTARVMFFNGISQQRNQKGELVPMRLLTNPNQEDNLAFSLQCQIEGMKYYPEMMRKIYLKAYRYSLHMKPMSLLIEVGDQYNTSEEAVNTAQPLADMLAKVLEKD